MTKQWLRKKPFYTAIIPIPWWIGMIAIFILLLILLAHFQIPVSIETRV